MSYNIDFSGGGDASISSGSDTDSSGSPDNDSSGGSVGPSRQTRDTRTDGDAGASFTVTPTGSDSDSDNAGSPDNSDSGSSGGGSVSDTAIGASFRDPALERAAKETQGQDAADAVAAGGVAAAINYSDTTVNEVAEDTEATGTTQSLTDGLKEAFPPGVENSAEMNPLPEFTGAVERVRERIVIPFTDREANRGSILTVVAVVIALGAVVIGSSNSDGSGSIYGGD